MEPYLHSHADLRCAVLNCGTNSPLPEISRPDVALALQCVCNSYVLQSSWNVMAHSDEREGKWRGNWRMVWVASILRTTSEHGVSSITTADAHTWAASSRLNWRHPADLNGLVRFAERRNLVSARVPSRFKRSLLTQLIVFPRIS